MLQGVEGKLHSFPLWITRGVYFVFLNSISCISRTIIYKHHFNLGRMWLVMTMVVTKVT